MKKVTKAEDESFVIGARQNGTESGIKDAELKVADGITATVKPGNGSYGEFLRVDLTGNYGDLGAHMQSVEWAYYGNDSTYTNRLANYGTKFAADNWMHNQEDASFRKEQTELVTGSLLFMPLDTRITL